VVVARKSSQRKNTYFGLWPKYKKTRWFRMNHPGRRG
jgi:hypothetical protein